MRPFIAWCPGLPDDVQALSLVRESDLVSGVETSGIKDMQKMQSAGVAVSLHNVVRGGFASLGDARFSENFSNTNLLLASESDAKTLGFHLPSKYSGSVQDVFSVVCENVSLLKKLFPDKQLVLEIGFAQSGVGDAKSTDILFAGEKLFCSQKNLSELFSFLHQKHPDVSFLLDISHAFIVAESLGHFSSWDALGDWTLSLCEQLSWNVGQLHLNVPSRGRCLADNHALFDDTVASQQVFRVARKVLSNCASVVTLEMSTGLSPVLHVKKLLSQAELLLREYER